MVKWTTPAKQDLKQIHDYIARDSKFYAKKVSLEIVEKSEKLNPPTEKRAKQINVKDLEKDNSKILSEAGTQGIVIKDDVLSYEIEKLQLYKEEPAD